MCISYHSIDINKIQHTDNGNHYCLDSLLISSRKANSPVERILIPGQENSKELTWKDFLDKVDSVFPDILLCSYVCKARVNHHEVAIASYSDTL